MAAWVKQYDLDGIDVDYEDFNAFAAGDGKAEVPYGTLNISRLNLISCLELAH
jgi:hypothetical protein